MKTLNSIPRNPNGHRCSFAQRRLWFIAQLSESDWAFNEPLLLELRGDLKIKALNAAIDFLIARHESLRTLFIDKEGEPLQVVHPSKQILLKSENVGHATEAEIQRWIKKPFDLVRGPLFRARLFEISSDYNILAFNFHHIICDGWSFAIFLRELQKCYDAFCCNRQPDLTQLSCQPIDFAEWQQKTVCGPDFKQRLSKWVEHLRSSEPLLLPALSNRSQRASRKARTVRFKIEKHEYIELKSVARQFHVTPFTLLFSAYQMSLWHYTDQTNFSIGVPSASRDLEEIEPIIGLFANTIPMRSVIDPEVSVLELWSQLHEANLKDFARQDIPFESLVEILNPERDTTQNPIFQVSFNKHVSLMRNFEMGDVRASVMKFDLENAKIDLSLQFEEVGGDWLDCDFIYNAELFAPAMIEQFANDMLSFLKKMCRAPQSKLKSILLRSRKESLGKLDFVETNRTLHKFFIDRARLNPSQIAVVCDDKNLSYERLDHLSDQVAAKLQTEGLEHEDIVGIYLPRALESIVSILGILKAGGIFMPLDPEDPPERTALKVAAAQPRFVIVKDDTIDVLGTAIQVRISSTLEEQIAPKISNQMGGAYILFTSGSSGQPKGVVITHSNIVHYSEAISKTMSELLNCRLEGLQFATVTTLNADLGNTCVMPSLLNGGTLHLMPQEIVTDAALFASYIQTNKIDILKIVPNHFAALFTQAEAIPKRLLIFGGESLGIDLVRKVFEQRPDLKICNHYGPTETCVGSVMTTLVAQDLDQLKLVNTLPLGRAIGGARLLVLNQNQEVVAPYVTGELYIGGPGVARGYVNDKALTQEKFIILDGERFYRTGDFVRQTPQGFYYFMGRKDRQVKIRGFRVELSEVEQQLMRHPLIRSAVVHARRDESGTHHLIAFVEAANLSVSQLAKDSARTFPTSSLPSHFVVMDALPRTANGKPDQNALTALQLIQPQTNDFKPTDKLQMALADIWMRLLGQTVQSSSQHFFRCGGHSLLAMRLIARIQAELNLKVPVQIVFRFPRFNDLVEQIRLIQSEIGSSPLIETFSLHGAGPYPLTDAQQRLWFLAKMNPQSPFYNELFFIRIKGELNISALNKALSYLVQRHEQLRAQFQEHNGIINQSVSNPTIIQLEPVKAQTENLQTDLNTWARRPFDLQSDPLYRFQLWSLSQNENILGFCAHHIVCDGWSMQILRHELKVSFEAFCKEQTPPLPKLVTTYIGNKQNSTEVISLQEKNVKTWAEKLKVCENLNFPLDRPRPAFQKHQGGHFSFCLTNTDELQKISVKNEATLFHTLLAGFAVLLSRYTNQTDFAIGLPVANRPDVASESLVGLFVNTVALPAHVSPSNNFEDAIEQIKNISIEALSLQNLPFERLVQVLNPSRDLSHSPIFQVLFNYNRAYSETSWSNLQTSVVLADLSISKFDISLHIEEGEQLVCTFEYNTALFNHTTIVRMADHFKCLLKSAAQDSKCKVEKLNILSPDELETVTRTWNQTDVSYPEHICIHEQIERSCKINPDAVAVEFEGEKLTYKNLDLLSARLAALLNNKGIKKGDLVGVLMERSTHLVISLLACLRSGAVYVPLDPGYPEDRIQYMIKDSNPKIVLTQQIFKEVYSNLLLQTEFVCVTEKQLSERVSSQDLVALEPHDLAYMIYTSGSTGQPKGALNTHAGIYNRLAWMQKQYCLRSNDVVLQKTPFSFDVSVWEFFWPLMYGAKLVVAKPNGHKDPQYLIDLINSQSVTILHFVPSMLHAFLMNEDAASCKSLRLFVCSGEALPLDLQHRFFMIFGSEVTQLHNLYGPTEAAVDVTYWQCMPNSDLHFVPIGRPIDNIQMYILDKVLAPVPIGIAGELYIGGVGVGRGYLNKPELTDERFIQNPFTQGQTLYKTGDRARFLSDSNIEYLGRFDHQVKLRGFRIELGEIEVAISDFKGVERSVVIVRDSSGGQKQLVAYIKVQDNTEIKVSELSKSLKSRLPDHMIPAAFVFIKTVPVTPNGKVDYKQLPAPLQNSSAGDLNCVLTQTEESIAQVWKDVLGHNSFGLKDNFFDVGGSSLSLLQIQSRLARQFERRIALTDLFRSPTIASISDFLKEHKEQKLAPLPNVNLRRSALSNLERRRT